MSLEKLAQSAIKRGLIKEAKIIIAQMSADGAISRTKWYATLSQEAAGLTKALYDTMGDASAAAQVRAVLPNDLYVKLVNFDQTMTWNELEKAVQDLYQISKQLPTLGKVVIDFARKFHSAFSQYMAELVKEQGGNHPPQAVAPKAAPAKPMDTAKAAKIEQIQTALGANLTGHWDLDTNANFIAFLKQNGMANYLVGNKFKGTLDDALKLVLDSKKAPSSAPVASAQ